MALATILAPLNRLLRQDNPAQWVTWPPSAQAAFDLVKAKLAATPCLDYFRPDKPLVLAVDASQYGVRAVLMHQYGDGSDRPIA